MVVTYHFPADVRLEYDPATGAAITRYDDGHWSGCKPVPEDIYHAVRLGISPGKHRLAHEMAHHIVGYFFGHPYGSDVIWRDAHGAEQDDDSRLEEWYTTGLTYFAFGVLEKSDADGDYPGAVRDLMMLGMDVPHMGSVLKEYVAKTDGRRRHFYLRPSKRSGARQS